MVIHKSLQTGSNEMLILQLIEEEDRYGYQIIETLARRSDDTFVMKAGTLYPLLRGLEEKDLVESYERESPSGRGRRYYRITESGRRYLEEKRSEWKLFTAKVNKVIGGAQ